jgi:AraC-like DNA-binding protein
VDVLSDLLRAVRLTGAIFFDMHFRAPFVSETPPMAAIASSVMPEAEQVFNFHVLLNGLCFAEIADGAVAPVALEEGDVVMYPRGDANILCSKPGLRHTPDLAHWYRPFDRQLPFVPNEEGQGDRGDIRFVCGFLGCDAKPFNPLLEALPRLFQVSLGAAGKGWVGPLIRLAVDECQARRAGSESILAKASELMFVQAIRLYTDTLPSDSRGWLAGLRDRHVGAALRLIHGQPSKPWTLDGLARETGLSRTVFAERFTRLVGVAPMQYVARWRLQLAARRLEAPGGSMAEIAAEAGYESEAAFSRAFKKHAGVPPGAWRRRSHKTEDSGSGPGRSHGVAAIASAPR